MIKAVLSRHDLPCMWEEGGSATHTGSAQIICNAKGQAKKAIYVRKRGTLCCDKHALIPVRVGDYIIRVYHCREDFTIYIMRIIGIQKYFTKKNAKGFVVERFKEVITSDIAIFSKGQWNNEPPKELNQAIQKAKDKATCYHCRTPFFIKRKEFGYIDNQ
jgi:hypothetical protein